MVAASPFRYNPKARVPFLNQLAREFKRNRAHIWRLCTGERQGPLRERVRARQAELIRSAESAVSLPGRHTGPADPVLPAGKATVQPSSAS